MFSAGVGGGGGSRDLFELCHHAVSTSATTRLRMQGEYFEAGIASLTFAIVGLLVWLLVRQLRANENNLARNSARTQASPRQASGRGTLAAVGRLSSAIAHEIRNPVAMISSSLAMAKRCHSDSGTARRDVRDRGARGDAAGKTDNGFSQLRTSSKTGGHAPFGARHAGLCRQCLPRSCGGEGSEDRGRGVRDRSKPNSIPRKSSRRC